MASERQPVGLLETYLAEFLRNPGGTLPRVEIGTVDGCWSVRLEWTPYDGWPRVTVATRSPHSLLEAVVDACEQCKRARERGGRG